MTGMNYSQQRGLFDPRFANAVTVIGAGAVGSQVVTKLARIGVPDITVYDADSVESHNIPNSAYGNADLGLSKVAALEARIRADCGTAIRPIPRMYAGERLAGTVVACVDTMEARQEIWRAAKDNPNVDLLVDTRTARALFQVFAVRPCDPEDIKFYEYFLRYKTEEAVRDTCGEHGIVFVSGAAADVACWNLTVRWSTGKTWERHFVSLSGRQSLPNVAT